MQLYRLPVIFSEFPSQYRHKFGPPYTDVSAHEILHVRMLEPPSQL